MGDSAHSAQSPHGEPCPCSLRGGLPRPGVERDHKRARGCEEPYVDRSERSAGNAKVVGRRQGPDSRTPRERAVGGARAHILGQFTSQGYSALERAATNQGGPSAVQMVESFDVEAYLEAQIEPAAARQEDAHEQQDARGPVEHENRAHDRDGRPRDDQPRDHGVKRQRYDDRRSEDRSRHRDDRHRRYDYRDDRDGRRRGGERDDRRRDYDRRDYYDRRDERRYDRRRSRSRSPAPGRDRREARERRGRSRSTSEDKRQTEQEVEEKRQKDEINDLTKDQRTVFVSQLVMKVNERNIREFFEKIGKVNDVILIRDKYTNRHKGFAYVEMADLETVPMVLMLCGTVPDFQKFPILVKASEAEKNFLAKQETVASAAAPQVVTDGGGNAANANRLYIGNLHVNITEDDLKTVLSPFGEVEQVQIHRDEVGTSKGYAFVRFANSADAQVAMNKLSGLELAGKAIKVGFVTENTGNASSTAASGIYKLSACLVLFRTAQLTPRT